MGLFSKIASGLKKTKDFLFGGIQRVLNQFTVIDEDLFDELEEQMIMSDIGVETSEEICDRLRKKIKERGITDPKEIMGLIHEVISEIMGNDTGLDLSVSPAVIMVIGVNGAGKTTTIGKLCHQFKQEGKKVLVAAADTFRAAAIDQLEVWTQRAGVDIVKHAEGSDPGAVVYDALEAAKARECDVVVIDTAGRLHNKKNLMEELKKINRIIDTKAGDCSREVLLVLDATTGQNAVNQAKLFSETAPITGIVLTKLDGTAKGGIVISIKNELGIPVKLIGVGEKIDDLQPFDSNMFVDALFASPEQLEELAEAEEDEENESEGYTEDTEYEEDEETVEVDGVKGYYNEYGAFVAYEEDEEADEAEPEYEEEDYEEESEEETEAETESEVESDDEAEADEDTEAEESELTEAAEDESYEDESDDAEDSDEADEEETAEEETETAAEPEKKKKRGFFSRLFGGKDND
ncbi:signal recognition particle-docking protein FtsY [Ruminococcus flavefaciens]|uniref:Signal recognition particle receptor FtsY n=1 Tax=Ruminococcus flavefaciens TaxID=1265 RepID=A0A1K1LL56_RUMFL|nr:signal recognition particle-docking protein FtsY [Ruminococcus flavefaciens]